MMKKTVILLSIMLFSAGLFGQNVTITAKTDASTILLGDQIHFVISAEIPADATLVMPAISDTLTGKVIVLGTPKRNSEALQNGRKKITDEYLITSFDQGTYTIPPIECAVSENGISKNYSTNSIMLSVTKPTVAPADTSQAIFDIIGPRKAPVIFAEVLPWIIIFAVIVLIIWLLMKFLPRNPLMKFLKKEKPAEPAHITAYRELENLRKEELWQKGEIKEYYSRLSDILRRYIDGRFDIESPELTTDETVRKLQKSGYVSNDVLSVVKVILADADMVKFAKFKPEDEFNASSIEKATKVVDVTKPVETAPENPSSSDNKGGKNA